jgi:hypothetical protein
MFNPTLGPRSGTRFPPSNLCSACLGSTDKVFAKFFRGLSKRRSSECRRHVQHSRMELQRRAPPCASAGARKPQMYFIDWQSLVKAQSKDSRCMYFFDWQSLVRDHLQGCLSHSSATTASVTNAVVDCYVFFSTFAVTVVVC